MLSITASSRAPSRELLATRSSTVWVSLGNAAQLLPASSLGCLVQSFSVVLSSLENVLCSQVLHSSGLLAEAL